MTRKLHFFLAAFIVGVSLFVFQSMDSKDSLVPSALKAPSMIPGAEAVRPTAAHQSGRIEALVSEIKAQDPVESASEPSSNP